MQDQIAGYISAYLEGELFGISFVQLTIWVVIGTIAGSLLPKPRPFGLIGSMIGGILGGLLAGWSVAEFDFLDISQYLSGVSRSLREPLSAGISAFAGAVVVLAVLRLVVPKSMRN